MIVVTHGTNKFNDYSIFLSGMRTALINLPEGDDTFTIFSAGPVKVNNMALEFLNVANLKARGIKTKLVKIPQYWIKDNYEKIDFLAFYALPKEPIPDIIKSVGEKDVNVQVYRF